VTHQIVFGRKPKPIVREPIVIWKL